MASGTVEWQWPWNDDLVQLPNGDLATIQDTYDDPAATVQRLEVIVMMNPTLRDETGAAIGPADDLYNQDTGSGARALIGELADDDVVFNMRARVAKAISTDPGIAKVPAPVIDVQDQGDGTLTLQISGQTTSGQPFTTPAWPLTTIGG